MTRATTSLALQGKARRPTPSKKIPKIRATGENLVYFNPSSAVGRIPFNNNLLGWFHFLINTKNTAVTSLTSLGSQKITYSHA